MLKGDGRIAEIFDIRCIILAPDRIHPDSIHGLIGWGTEAALLPL